MVSVQELEEELLITTRQLNSLNKSLKTLREEQERLESDKRLLTNLLMYLKEFERLKAERWGERHEFD